MHNPITLEIIRHFVTGQALFSGAMLLVLAVVWRFCEWRGQERVVWLLAVVGATVIAFSSTPFVSGGVFLTALVTAGWLVLGKSPSSALKEERNAGVRKKFSVDQLLGFAVIILWCGECYQEVRYQVMPPSLALQKQMPIVVLGDSISAGMEENEAVTWPRLLRDRDGLNIIDLSAMGATVSSATRLLPQEFPEEAIVVIELGGNDLFSEISSGQFESDLEELLKRVSGPGRKIVIFELPLPPFQAGYGHAQRMLAKKYNATLIPKRRLAKILISPETTLDSIHLNQQGQDQFAQLMREVLSIRN